MSINPWVLVALAHFGVAGWAVAAYLLGKLHGKRDLYHMATYGTTTPHGPRGSGGDVVADRATGRPPERVLSEETVANGVRDIKARFSQQGLPLGDEEARALVMAVVTTDEVPESFMGGLGR